MKEVNCHQTHVILALQCQPEQAEVLGCLPPLAMQVHGEKTKGKHTCTLWQEDFTVAQKLLSLSWMPDSIFSVSKLACLFSSAGFNICLLATVFIFAQDDKPSWTTATLIAHQQLRNPSDFSCFITSIFSVFNLFLNVFGKLPWISTNLAMPVHKSAAKVGKHSLYLHIFLMKIRYINRY